MDTTDTDTTATDTTDDESEYGLKSGDMIAGKYRVECEIGRGGMGVVLAATHVDLDQRVAIKVLQRSSAFDQDALTRFVREARSAAKIRNEHVTRVMDVGKLDDGLAYIVMEHLDGADLSDVLQEEGSLQVTTAADYILQACEGMAAAHAAGIIHRDIKPANLFLADQPGRANIIKILDFGVSKVSKNGSPNDDASATRTGQIFGSPMYMSPEQLDSTVAVDCRTDIWALGVVLFELLAGKPPFGGKSSANIMTAVIRDPAPKLRTLRPDVPAALEEVVARCLEKDRDLRYATVIDLAEAIAPFCGKGADEAVDRIYHILADAATNDIDTTGMGSLGETSESRKRTPSGRQSDRRGSGRQSDRRRSGPRSDSGAPSLDGSDRINELARTNSKRLALIVAIACGLALAIVGAFVLQRNAVPTVGNQSSSNSPAVPSAPASIPVPSSSPSVETIDAQAPLSTTVTIMITGAPKATKVFRGTTEIGSVASPVRLPRSDEKVILRFVADTFTPVEMELIPNVDQTLPVTMKPARPNTGTPTKKIVPKELEPF